MSPLKNSKAAQIPTRPGRGFSSPLPFSLALKLQQSTFFTAPTFFPPPPPSPLSSFSSLHPSLGEKPERNGRKRGGKKKESSRVNHRGEEEGRETFIFFLSLLSHISLFHPTRDPNQQSLRVKEEINFPFFTPPNKKENLLLSPWRALCSFFFQSGGGNQCLASPRSRRWLLPLLLLPLLVFSFGFYVPFYIASSSSCHRTWRSVAAESGGREIHQLFKFILFDTPDVGVVTSLHFFSFLLYLVKSHVDRFSCYTRVWVGEGC